VCSRVPSRTRADMQAVLFSLASELSDPPARTIVVAPRTPCHCVNRGRNGDRVGDMLLRLPTEVSPENPNVVIWQLGTNALLTGLGRDDFGSLFSRGMRKSRMRAPT
jgi:acyl-CoA thioesterase I